MTRRFCLYQLTFGTFLLQQSRAKDDALALSLKRRLAEGLSALNQRYYSPTLKIWLDRPGDDLRGHFEGRINPPWWSAANAVEAMIDWMSLTGSTEFIQRLSEMHDLHQEPMKRWPVVAEALKQRGQWSEKDSARLARKRAKHPYERDFCNEYLDDSGWWGVAWLKMAEHTKEAKYLKTARAIQSHMAQTWQGPGGGVLWCLDEDKRKTNTITNCLFVILSARLAAYTSDQAIREWAVKGWKWLEDPHLFDGKGIVDGPGTKDDHWSYNQGAYIGAALAMHSLTSEKTLLDQASLVAKSTLESGFLSPDGRIQEKLGTSGWDGCLFKGIMCRYWGQLCRALRRNNIEADLAQRLQAALNTSSQALIDSPQNENGQFPADWHAGGPNQERNFNTDLSGLLCLMASLNLEPVTK